MVQKLKNVPFTDYILLFALLGVGGFHEYVSCILCVAMTAWLLLRREKKLQLDASPMSFGVLALCFGYGSVCLWAVDKGMAFAGFLKFLPLLLFLICRKQEEKKSVLLGLLPYVGAAMTVSSALGMLIPATKEWFSVADRLAGFFQYPNVFAIFLLVCQLLLWEKEKRNVWDYAVLAILLGGILYSGSRTAFAVAVVANMVMLPVVAKKKLPALLTLAAVAVVAAVVIVLFRENPVIGRFLRFSLTESTFAGRLLYMLDALPLLLKYPLGMGYMGYSFTQQSVQTGLYSVTYVHNDLLQLLLDVGLVYTLPFVLGLGHWFFRKDVKPAHKVMVAALCLHSLMDFDLQYIGIFLLLIKLTETATDKKPMVFPAWTAAPVALCALYMAVALSLSAFGLHQAAVAVYPGNTVSNLKLLEQTTDPQEANTIADRILKTNKKYYAPYSAKAKYAATQGDFATMIANKQKVFAANPFGYAEYEEYCQMLLTGISLYEKKGDSASIAVCRKELHSVLTMLRKNEERLSPLGRAIEDQPITQLPKDLENKIRALK
ncbi:MAG: O-antigen ligase family protein [Oscillospiraceae bacterium]|nr:O-antigen ligase family protein [Oscillospiraceae bacterium]